MKATPKDDMIADARDGIESGLEVRILLGGVWLRVAELTRYNEVGLVRAEQADGTMVLFEDADLVAISVKGH